MDNLQSVTYQTFEQDPVKYRHYEEVNIFLPLPWRFHCRRNPQRQCIELWLSGLAKSVCQLCSFKVWLYAEWCSKYLLYCRCRTRAINFSMLGSHRTRPTWRYNLRCWEKSKCICNVCIFDCEPSIFICLNRSCIIGCRIDKKRSGERASNCCSEIWDLSMSQRKLTSLSANS